VSSSESMIRVNSRERYCVVCCVKLRKRGGGAVVDPVPVINGTEPEYPASLMKSQ
jgi:hypothetical protein